MASRLTPRQQKFVDEYLIDLNATQAAIRAGYSSKTAYSIGVDNLRKPEIQAALQRKQKKLQSKLEITQEKILRELACIAFANGADYARVVVSGDVEEVQFVPTEDLPPEKKAAIAGIKAGVRGIEVKLHDKVKALELLGKYLGTFDGANAESEDPQININIISAGVTDEHSS